LSNKDTDFSVIYPQYY